MKKFLLSTFCSAFFSFTAFSADTYQIDKTHTNVVWYANHFGFSNSLGKFNDVSGKVRIDERNPQNSSVEIEIKTASINTGIPKFDNHLKNQDFLDVEKYPNATFISTRVDLRSKTRALVRGNLTLLGITKPITLDVTLNKIGTNPIIQRKTVGFSAKAKFKRSLFGMNYGIPGISDEVIIKIQTEANLMSSEEYSESIKPKTAGWKVVQDKSKLDFEFNQDNSSIRGSFKKFGGEIKFDPNKIQDSNINIDIDTSSLELSFVNALETAKSSKWLATSAFPKANFKARNFVKLSAENKYQAKGHLTIKGRSIPTTITFTLEKYGKLSAKATGNATINRNRFGVGDENFAKSNKIDDEIKINFTINAQKE